MTARLTHEEYEARAGKLGIRVLDEYQGRKVKLRHVCVCGETWMITPDNVLKGALCNKCGYVNRARSNRKTQEQYERELESLSIKLLDPYVNSTTKIAHLCICGRVFRARPHRVLEGDKCGICTKGKDKLKTDEYYRQALKEKNVQVVPVETYVNMRTKILHRCICGNEWRANPLNVLNGWLCGCERSKGEVLIRKWLERKGIAFEQEFSFPDLKYRRKLRFDFAIFHDGSLLCLVEFHGRQHFQRANTWHQTDDDFKELQVRDSLKREYARQKNLPLIEIKYDENCLAVLEKSLTQLGLFERRGQHA